MGATREQKIAKYTRDEHQKSGELLNKLANGFGLALDIQTYGFDRELIFKRNVRKVPVIAKQSLLGTGMPGFKVVATAPDGSETFTGTGMTLRLALGEVMQRITGEFE